MKRLFTSMNIIFAVVVLLTLVYASVESAQAQSAVEKMQSQASVDKVEIDENGHLLINGQKIYITRLYDGKQIALKSNIFFEISGKNPGVYLSTYWDKSVPNQQSTTQHIIVIDATGKEIGRSNVLDTGIEFEWGDNNYVLFDHGAMYFGIYSPKRMQFVYRDGKLEENKAPWRGPAKPEKYIEPEHPGPCYNVADVPACIEEVEKAEAAKRAKQKHKAKLPVSAPKPAISQ